MRWVRIGKLDLRDRFCTPVGRDAAALFGARVCVVFCCCCFCCFCFARLRAGVGSGVASAGRNVSSASSSSRRLICCGSSDVNLRDLVDGLAALRLSRSCSFSGSCSDSVPVSKLKESSLGSSSSSSSCSSFCSTSSPLSMLPTICDGVEATVAEERRLVLPCTTDLRFLRRLDKADPGISRVAATGCCVICFAGEDDGEGPGGGSLLAILHLRSRLAG